MVYYEQFDCIYTAKGKGGDSEDSMDNEFSVPLHHYACFSDVYRHLRKYDYCEVTYDIYLYKENIKGKQFNLCSSLETRKILRCLQKTVDFTYKFKEAQYTKSDYSKTLIDFNVLTVTIKGNYAQHLWITSMLRCFFEWPFNVAAKEACELQSRVKIVDDFDCSKENWINLYLTIAAQLGSYSLHGVVNYIGLHPKAKTYQEWKYKLANITDTNEIYKCLARNGGRFDQRKSVRVDITSQEEYDQGVTSRASKYVAAYKDKLSWKK